MRSRSGTSRWYALTNHTITGRDRRDQEIERGRAQGCAIVDQAREQGMRSAVAPIRDFTDQVVAAIKADLARDLPHARAR